MQNKKNILMVVGNVWDLPSGIGNISKLLNSYIKDNEDINLKVLVDSKGSSQDNITALDLNKKFFFLQYIFIIIKLIFWADIVHFQSTSKMQILVNTFANIFSKRQVVTFHGTDIWYGKNDDKYMNKLLSSVSDIVTLSTEHLKELKRRFNLLSTIKFHTIPYAFLDKKINLTHKKQNNEFNIITPKGFGYIKKDEESYYCKNVKQILDKGFLVGGQDMLVYTISKLVERGYTNVRVSFLGGRDKNIEKYVDQLDLNKYIKFFGSVSQEEVYKNYSKSDVMICPSILESWSNVQIEALYFHLPVIASNTAGTIDQINKYKLENIFSFDVGDIEALIQTIIDIMENKSDISFDTNDEILKRELSIEVISNKFINIYKGE